MPKSPPPRRKTEPTAAAAPAKPSASVDQKRKSADALNPLLAFVEFVADHPVGSPVDAEVESFSSHGAYVIVDGVRCYVPLRFLGKPAPRSAREVLALGEKRSFTVVSIAAGRRGVDLALPGFEPEGVTVTEAPPARRKAATKKAKATAKPEKAAEKTDKAAEKAAAAPKADTKKAATKKAPAKKAAAKKAAAPKETATKTGPAKVESSKVEPSEAAPTEAASKAETKKAVAKRAPRKSVAKKSPATKKSTACSLSAAGRVRIRSTQISIDWWSWTPGISKRSSSNQAGVPDTPTSCAAAIEARSESSPSPESIAAAPLRRRRPPRSSPW